MVSLRWRAVALSLFVCCCSSKLLLAQASLDRTVLPIPEPKIPHSTVFNARNAKPPARFQVKAPANAPNVLIVLIDDMGFGMSSGFGGPITMPTLDRLANAGLRYNHFHTAKVSFGVSTSCRQWIKVNSAQVCLHRRGRLPACRTRNC